MQIGLPFGKDKHKSRLGLSMFIDDDGGIVNRFCKCDFSISSACIRALSVGRFHRA